MAEVRRKREAFNYVQVLGFIIAAATLELLKEYGQKKFAKFANFVKNSYLCGEIEQ